MLCAPRVVVSGVVTSLSSRVTSLVLRVSYPLARVRVVRRVPHFEDCFEVGTGRVLVKCKYNLVKRINLESFEV